MIFLELLVLNLQFYKKHSVFLSSGVPVVWSFVLERVQNQSLFRKHRILRIKIKPLRFDNFTWSSKLKAYVFFKNWRKMNSCTQKVVELRAGNGRPEKVMELLTWNAQRPWYPNDVFSKTHDVLILLQLLNHKLPGISSPSHCFLDDFLGALGFKLTVLQKTHRVSQFRSTSGVELRIRKGPKSITFQKTSHFTYQN